MIFGETPPPLCGEYCQQKEGVVMSTEEMETMGRRNLWSTIWSTIA